MARNHARGGRKGIGMRERCWSCGEDLILSEWCSGCLTKQPEPDIVDEQQVTPLDQLIEAEQHEEAVEEIAV